MTTLKITKLRQENLKRRVAHLWLLGIGKMWTLPIQDVKDSIFQ